MEILSSLYNVYTQKIGFGNPVFCGIRYLSLCRAIVRSVTYLIMPIYYRLNRKELAKTTVNESAKKKIVVSLTSFPIRINGVSQVIESLFHQTKQPNIIKLYLSKEQFPKAFMDLPSSLIELQNRGLMIEFVDGDIRSHKKYYYAFQEYPNDLIITVDDDVYYHPNMIEHLYNDYLSNPHCVISNQTAIIKYEKGNLLSYSKWGRSMTTSKTLEPLVQIGIGGVLYNPTLLYNDVLNIDLALQLCPFADDIWLNVMTRLNKVQIHKTALTLNYLPVYIKNNVTLCSINNGQNRNDTQINAIRDYYLKQTGIDVYGMNIYNNY